MKERRKDRLLAIGNLVFFVLMLLINGLANTVKIGGRTTGEVSDAIPNLFVPSGITFAIWGIIYLLLSVFTINQARIIFTTDEKLHELEGRVGLFYIISSILNILWLWAWHYFLISLSVPVMLCLLGSLIIIYLRLGIGRVKRSLIQKILEELPFSIYLGWITVATIANVTAVLVDLGWDRLGLSEELWAVVMIAAASGIALLVLFSRRDLAFALVVAWAFLGIWLKRTQAGTAFVPSVAYSALGGLGIIFLGLGATVISLILRRKKEGGSLEVDGKKT